MRRNIWKIVFLMVKSGLKDDLQVFLARRTEKVAEIMAALESDEDLFCELIENTLFLGEQ